MDSCVIKKQFRYKWTVPVNGDRCRTIGLFPESIESINKLKGLSRSAINNSWDIWTVLSYISTSAKIWTYGAVLRGFRDIFPVIYKHWISLVSCEYKNNCELVPWILSYQILQLNFLSFPWININPSRTVTWIRNNRNNYRTRELCKSLNFREVSTTGGKVHSRL